jgi:hypothetical protein
MQTVKLSELTEEICRDWLLVKCTNEGLIMDEVIKIDYDKKPAIIESYIGSEPPKRWAVPAGDSVDGFPVVCEYSLLSKAEFIYEIKCRICGMKTLSRVYACGEWDIARDALYNNRCDVLEPGHDCEIERFSIIKRILYPIVITGEPPLGIRVLVETFNEGLKK